MFRKLLTACCRDQNANIHVATYGTGTGMYSYPTLAGTSDVYLMYLPTYHSNRHSIYLYSYLQAGSGGSGSFSDWRALSDQ